MKGLWQKIKGVFRVLNNFLFRTPPAYMLIVSAGLFIIFFMVTMLFLMVGSETNFFSGCVYALCPFTLGYTIFLSVRKIKDIKESVGEFLIGFNPTRKFFTDYALRSAIFSFVSFVINVGYALVMAVFGIVYKQIWYGALAIYYISLSVLRGWVLWAYKRTEAEKGSKIYAKCGGAIAGLGIAMTPAVTQMVMSRTLGLTTTGFMVLLTAAYTFFKIISSIVNVVKATKYRDRITLSLRAINLADAAISLVAMETALDANFSDGEDVTIKILNFVVGGLACLFVFILGLFMLISESTKICRAKRLKSEEDKYGE